MQEDRHHGDPLLPDTVQQLRREVETGGRRGGGAVLFRIDGLVPVAVFQLFMDIRRKGHLAQTVEDLLKDAVVDKADGASADFLHIAEDLAGQEPVPENTAGSGLQPAAGADQGFPLGGAEAPEEQDFHRDAGILLDAEQARGNHAGLINDQRVSRIQVIDNVKEMPVFYGAILPAVNQQAALIPRFHGGLGDQLFRKFIIEIGGFHALSDLHPDLRFRRGGHVFLHVGPGGRRTDAAAGGPHDKSELH